ncbi:MAG: prepilin-type N-terminal cleavage/methylation domain-containing protein [Planctomycetes bacterium]|nr:prepilin-type N-terminal cleavage/methylation domain-containing protein [Planctomycetota bacterium]
MAARNRGFSILELLIAMSLFMVLGTALIALVTRAMDFLETGTAGGELQDKGADFLRSFVSDLENVVVERGTTTGLPLVRFLSDSVPVDSDGDGKVDYHAQRVAFVRSTNADVVDPVARLGGTSTRAEAYFDGQSDFEEASTGRLRALGGLEEVLYMAVPEPPKPEEAVEEGVPGEKPVAKEALDPGVLTLYRGVRSPVGGTGSLLDRDTVKTVDDLKKVAQPFLRGVLHFGVRFWSARTSSWDTVAVTGKLNAPMSVWDSTRGILPPGTGRNEFPLARGTASLTDPRDDVSPRMARVSFIYERSGRQADVDWLAGMLDETGRRLGVRQSTALALSSQLPYVKVGTEWVGYASRTEDRFELRERGALNTEAVSHRDGERVRAGVVMERTILIPNYREDWNVR